MRLVHDPSSRIRQPPFAVFQEGQEAEIEIEADTLGADVDPAIPGRRQNRARAIALPYDLAVDVAHGARAWRNGPRLIFQPQHAGRAGGRDECGVIVTTSRRVELWLD